VKEERKASVCEWRRKRERVYISGGGETTTYRTPVLLALVPRKPSRQGKKETKEKTCYELNTILAIN
jgi:hypothetical protein